MVNIETKIGDIVEIVTSAGLAYVQFTHAAGSRGELVRVLPGLYASRPLDFAELTRQKELYTVFYTLDYALRTNQAQIVSNQPLPEWALSPPMMRHAAASDEAGKTTRWRIISAASRLTPEELVRTPLLTELTPEQARLSILEICPHEVMIKRLVRGWTPQRAEELRLTDAPETAEKKRNRGSGHESQETGTRHFLYFLRKSDAEGAGEQLRSRGFSVDIRKSADAVTWLVLALKTPPRSGNEMDEIREDMEILAAHFGGEYDGWEAAIDSLGSDSIEKVN
jgi:hypothetical protein